MEIGAATLKPVSLFYSYSHRDEEFRSALETHLSVLRRSRLIAEWHDRMIGAIGNWRGEIDRNLVSADVVLLLISADFLASDYCWGSYQGAPRDGSAWTSGQCSYRVDRGGSEGNDPGDLRSANCS